MAIRTKELKPVVRDVLDKDVWHGNDHMVDYCMNQIEELVQLDNGFIVSIEKQRIEKDFCFGYSDSPYDTEEYDAANALAYKARTDESYFIDENMKEFRKVIKMLDGEEDDYYGSWNRQIFYLVTPYSGQDEESIYKGELCSCRATTFIDAVGGSADLNAVKGTTVITTHFSCPLSEGTKMYILSDKDIADIREGYVRAMEKHEKKVRNYLKRYGLSKVHSWSYWRDE